MVSISKLTLEDSSQVQVGWIWAKSGHVNVYIKFNFKLMRFTNCLFEVKFYGSKWLDGNTILFDMTLNMSI